MRALSLGALTCLFAALAACTGTPDPRTEDADAALQRGDPEAAFTLYRDALDRRPGDPLLAEKLAVAKSEAAALHLERARDLSSTGRFEEARNELASARRWTPDDPRIDDRRAELDRLESVTRAGIEAAIAEADAALARGEAGAALAALGRARDRFGALPAILEADARVRDTVTRRLTASAKSSLDADRPALATLLYRAAAQVSGSPPAGVAAAEKALAAARGATAAIAGVTDGTGGRASPSALGSHLLTELRARLPSPAWTIASGGPGDLRISVNVTRLDVGSVPPRTDRRRVECVIRIEQRENAAKPKLRATEQALVRSLKQARNVHEATRKELQSLEELEGSADIHAQTGRRFGRYTEAAYYRYLGVARAREANARNTVDDLDARLTEVRRRLSAEPDWLDVPIKAAATTDVTTSGRAAVAEATVALATPNGETSATVRSEVTATDESYDAIPASGIPANPITLPDESTIARQALDALAARIAESVSERAAEMRRGLLADADRLERAGDRLGALDRHVAFLLSTGEGLPIERGRAASEVEARTGIRIAGAGMDLSDLRID